MTESTGGPRKRLALVSGNGQMMTTTVMVQTDRRTDGESRPGPVKINVARARITRSPLGRARVLARPKQMAARTACRCATPTEKVPT